MRDIFGKGNPNSMDKAYGLFQDLKDRNRLATLPEFVMEARNMVGLRTPLTLDTLDFCHVVADGKVR